ncbi:MAG: histidine kinase [Saprospiraceae bacterium]|nr:histidine kinase [Saprospiraceae bacterium]
MKWYQSKLIAHLFFWLALLSALTYLEVVINGLTFGFALGNEFIRISFYAVLIYTNVYVLIPRFLSDRKLLIYGAFLILIVLVLTPLMINLFYWKYQGYPDLQDQVIQHQAGYYLLNFLLTSTFTVFKIISDWIKGERERRRIQTQNMQSELRFLKSQINPHFLFNTLNSLYALTIKKSDLAPEIVLRLADMMRYMLYECNEKWVPLSREVAYVENYLELEKLRHGQHADVHFTCEGDVQNRSIAPLMFIPFLENSFKHGLSRSLSTGYVHVSLKVTSEHVFFRIENNKPDSHPQPETRSFGGIGLTNVRKRLNMLYPDKHELLVVQDPLTFRVELTLHFSEEN